MIKQGLILVMVISLFFSASVYAHENCEGKDSPKKYSLLRNKNLPHLMPIILNHTETLKITENQKSEFQKIVSDVMEPFYSKAGETMKLEKEIAENVLKHGASKDDLAIKLRRLSALKQEVTEVHIGALNRIRKVLSDEQYKMLLAMVESGSGKCGEEKKEK